MIISLKTFKILDMPTGETTDHMGLKFFPETIDTLLLEVNHCEGILNQNKTLMKWEMIIE